MELVKGDETSNALSIYFPKCPLISNIKCYTPNISECAAEHFITVLKYYLELGVLAALSRRNKKL
jgi:hypothetical protein